MKHCIFTIICHAMVVLTALAAGETTGVVYTVAKMQVDYLPPLHIPRSGHHVMYVNGELVVMGGHTSGFVPTRTAEYLVNNTWNVMNMVYDHDFGMVMRLSSGEVLLAGGVEKELGVGQTYGIEKYVPATHSFSGFASMDQKRAMATGAEISGGRVVIAGNWHREDYIECFDGKLKSDSVKHVTRQRVYPYVLRSAPDDVMVLGTNDSYGGCEACTTVDCLKGEPLEVPLLGQWWPRVMVPTTENYQIGDESKGEYHYLIPAISPEGQMALIRIRGKQFELLPMACPIPKQSPWSDITYGNLLIDRKAGRAYLLGFGEDTRLYVAAVDYAQADTRKGAPLTLYYSEPVENNWKEFSSALTPQGDIVITGGHMGSNFEPVTTALRLHVSQKEVAPSGWMNMFWVAMVIVLALAAVVLWGGEHDMSNDDKPNQQEQKEALDAKQLMQSISELMEQKYLYLQSDLKLQDVAKALGVSTTKVSRCIKAESNTSFIQFINRYRVEHAQQMMLSQPDAKLTTVSMESGFANETSFFRVFKAITGLTPKEWLASQ